MKSFVLAISMVAGLMMVANNTHAQETKMNVKEWKAASQLLADAAEMIKINGWQQGAIEPVAQDCVTTALEKAFRKNENLTLVDLNYARALINEQIGAKVAFPESGPVNFSASDEPAVPYWGIEYMDWNDAPGRTEGAVIEALLSASSQAQKLAEAAASR